jgi:hypothetical protein
MNTQPIEKKFDPVSAGPINIVPSNNGWCVYTHPAHDRRMDYGGACYQCPTYVFTSPVELGIAIANLAQYGTITRPEPAPVYHVT